MVDESDWILQFGGDRAEASASSAGALSGTARAFVDALVTARRCDYVVTMSVRQSPVIAPQATLQPHQWLTADEPFDEADFARFVHEAARIDAAHKEIYDRVIRESRAPTADEMHRATELVRKFDLAQAKLERTRAPIN